MPEKKYPKGHWMGIGIAIGLPIAVAMFFIVDLLTGESGSMIALGPAIGVSMGVAIGAGLEKRYEGRIREPTPREERRQRRLVFAGIAILAAGAAAGLLAFMNLV